MYWQNSSAREITMAGNEDSEKVEDLDKVSLRASSLEKTLNVHGTLLVAQVLLVIRP